VGTKFKPKYSNCNAGSDQCAGWVKEGVEFYHDAWHKAVQARASPQCKALERAFLDWVKKVVRQRSHPSMLTLTWETLMMRGETRR
jgi:hypothetical protein